MITYVQCNKHHECPIADRCSHAQPHAKNFHCDPHGYHCSVGGYENEAGEWIAETIENATCVAHRLTD